MAIVVNLATFIHPSTIKISQRQKYNPLKNYFLSLSISTDSGACSLSQVLWSWPTLTESLPVVTLPEQSPHASLLLCRFLKGHFLRFDNNNFHDKAFSTVSTASYAYRPFQTSVLLLYRSMKHQIIGFWKKSTWFFLHSGDLHSPNISIAAMHLNFPGSTRFLP